MRKKGVASFKVCYFFLFFLIGYILYWYHSENLLWAIEPDQNDMEFIDKILPTRNPSDHFFVLKNGIALLIRKTSISETVYVSVSVKTGSIYESPMLGAGLSHYLEHVVSGGTTKLHSEEENEKLVQKMGGASNASTTYDITNYYIKTIPKYTNTAINLLISYVRDCIFKESEVKREKSVILEEIRLGKTSPGRTLWDLFISTAYRVHPVRLPIIGMENRFKQVKRDDLIRYYKKRYRPDNIVICVVGDVDYHQVLDSVIEECKSWWPSPYEAINIPTEPPQLTLREATRTFPSLRIARLRLGYRTISLTHPDLFAIDLLALIMGEGESSRLYQRLKIKDHLVFSINVASWTPPYSSGQFMIDATLNKQDIEKTYKTIKEEIEKIKEKGVLPEELKKAKRQLMAQHIFSRQSNESIGYGMSSSFIRAGNPYFDDDYLAGIMKITSDDIKQAARKYLTTARLTKVTLLPPEEEKEEKTIKNNNIAKTKVWKKVLKNGLILLIGENRELPIVSIKFYGLGGMRFEPSSKPGIAYMMGRLLGKGTKNRTRQEIRETIESMGATLATGAGYHTYYVDMEILKEDLEKSLDIIADILINPTFPKKELEREKKDILAAIKRRDENWYKEIEYLFKKNFFGNHPYGRYLLGTEESVKSLTQNDLISYYKKVFRPNRAVIAIYGDVEKEKVEELINKFFGKIKSKKPEISLTKYPETELTKDKEIIKKNRKVTSSIFMGFKGLVLKDKRRAALDVIDAVLSGIQYPSGWLQDSLRGGKNSLVYLVHAFPFYGLDRGYFGIICQTSPKNLDKVLTIIKEKVKDLSKKITEKELKKAKEEIEIMHKLSKETISSQARDAALNELLGLGYNWDKIYLEEVQKVQLKEIKELVKELFGHYLLVITIPENYKGDIPE